MVAEHGCDMPWSAPLEQISERICEQIVDFQVPQNVEQAIEVLKISSQDRDLHGTVEQIPDILVPETVEQLVKLPETMSDDGVQQRTVEQIPDAPVPQAVEELADISMVSFQDGIQQRIVEQTIPAFPLAEKIVELLVIQTEGTTQRGVNTHVQHVVNAVDVEKPKIIELTVQRKKFTIQEKINQETKPVESPQAQFSDKAGDMPRCCTTTGVHGPDSAESNGGSTVAVHEQGSRHPCRDAETDFHGPDCSEEYRDFTVAG